MVMRSNGLALKRTGLSPDMLIRSDSMVRPELDANQDPLLRSAIAVVRNHGQRHDSAGKRLLEDLYRPFDWSARRSSCRAAPSDCQCIGLETIALRLN